MGTGRSARPVHRRLGSGLLRALARPRDRPSPVPEGPRPCLISSFPPIDTYDFCLHLACNNEQRLNEVEAELPREREFGAPRRAASGSAGGFARRETRTGFVGSGLPARPIRMSPASRRYRPVPARAPSVHGLQIEPPQEPGNRGRGHDPPRGPVHRRGRRCRSATCVYVWTAGTADLSETERVARMYAPQVTPDRVQPASPLTLQAIPRLIAAIDQPLRRDRTLPELRAGARATTGR